MEKEFNRQLNDKVSKMGPLEIDQQLNGISDATKAVEVSAFSGGEDEEFLNQLGKLADRQFSAMENFSPELHDWKKRFDGKHVVGFLQDAKGKDKFVRMGFVVFISDKEDLLVLNNGTMAVIKACGEEDHFRTEKARDILVDYPVKRDDIDQKGKLKNDFSRELINSFDPDKFDVVLRSDDPQQKDRLLDRIGQFLRPKDPFIPHVALELREANRKEEEEKIEKEVGVFAGELNFEPGMEMDLWELSEEIKKNDEEKEAKRAEEARREKRKEDEMVGELLWELDHGRKLRKWEESRERELKYGAFETEKPVVEADGEELSYGDEELVKFFELKLKKGAAEKFLFTNSRVELEAASNK